SPSAMASPMTSPAPAPIHNVDQNKRINLLKVMSFISPCRPSNPFNIVSDQTISSKHKRFRATHTTVRTRFIVVKGGGRMTRYRKRWLGLFITATALLITGCGQDMQAGGMQSYKETKSMVLDILKTEDGKKAIQEASGGGGESGGGMQMLSGKQGQELQTAVKDILTDPNYNKQLKEMMTDPKFAGEFAKVIAKEDKQLHKDLMKDPEYQTMLIGVMKNPEAEKLMLEVLKGTAYRKQAMMIFQETLQNPLFKAELMDMMKKVIEEE